jgi:hypothetical protein
MNAEELIAKVCEKYSKCSSYRDRGVLRTSVQCWGDVHFETYYLAPKNILVRLVYGSQAKPIQIETFWSNGTEHFAHTSGTTEKCEKLKGDVDFFAFGLGTLFEFEVPMLLIPEAQQFAGRFTQCLELSERSKSKSEYVLRHAKDFGEELFQTTFEAFIDAKNLHVKSTKTVEKYSSTPTTMFPTLAGQPAPAAPVKTAMLGTAATFTPKLMLLFGKPNVFSMESISTECIYEEVRFDEQIPANLFAFRPAAGAT